MQSSQQSMEYSASQGVGVGRLSLKICLYFCNLPQFLSLGTG